MTGGLYDGPLAPGERDEYEADLISFCERELGLLGDIRGLDVLYAGGSSLLWIEGLSRRIGEEGGLTALDYDQESIGRTLRRLWQAELGAQVRISFGDIFEMPFEPGTFDLVYSSGVFHELDTRTERAEDALAYLSTVVRDGGRIATSDWVDTGEEVPPADLEWERLEAETLYEFGGIERYGIGPAQCLIRVHENVLTGVRWRISPPHSLRHLDKVMLAEPEDPPLFEFIAGEAAQTLRARRKVLFERIRREGYGRPATLYVEGKIAGG